MAANSRSMMAAKAFAIMVSSKAPWHGHRQPDAAALAASYAYGIARNHPFIDGNKRTAAVVSETFLLLNGVTLTASDAEVVVAFLALAAGELSEAELADWFRSRIDPA